MARWPTAVPIAFPRLLLALAVPSVAALALPLAAGEGFVGRYATRPTPDAPLRLVALDPHLPDGNGGSRTDRFNDGTFRVRWSGWLRVAAEGRHELRITAAGPGAISIDGVRVVEWDDAPGVASIRAPVVLGTGLVPILVEYKRTPDASGAPRPPRVSIDLVQPGQAPVPLGAPLVVPTALAAVLGPLVPGLASRMRDTLWLVLPAFWSIVLLAHLVAWLLGPTARNLRDLSGEPAAQAALASVLGAGAVTTLLAFWWGLPSSWAIDEIVPVAVTRGLRQWFSTDWHFWYPPFHYYLLGFVSAPFELAARLAFADPADYRIDGWLLGTYRVVTVACAVACVDVVYRLGIELHGRRAAAIAGALAVVLMPTFAYYGKLANVDVPYVLWTLVAVLWYVRAVQTGAPRAYHLFAATAALAVVTKDQAYGFFVLPVVHLVLRRWPGPGPSLARRGLAFVLDPVLWASAAIGAVVFALGHNLIFNWQGFLGHLALITGPGGVDFRMYDLTVAGQWAMFRDAVVWAGWAMGWPSFAASLAGVAWAIRHHRQAALALLLPCLSYYVFFIGYTRYHHDRFFIGVTMILAVFGGIAVAWSLGRERGRWGRGLALAVIAVLAWRAASVDLLMLRDSRYEAERRLRRMAGLTRTVGFAGPVEFLPRQFAVRGTRLHEDWRDVVRHQPDFLVINADYAHRPREGRPSAGFYRRLQGERHGYSRVMRYKAPPGAALLGWTPLFADEYENAFTNLDKINPTIEIYRRVGAVAP